VVKTINIIGTIRNNIMIYTNKIQDAVHFSIEVHQLTGEPQFRKGKAVPYVTHPLTVGLILSQAGASEDVVIAGILHDTIEDSDNEHKVTREMLSERFGEEVAVLVDSVSEKNRELSWHERKEVALEEIRRFSPNSLLLKSGDVISNTTELLRDYDREGEVTFQRFNAPKEQLLSHTQLVIETILEAWPENPLAEDLKHCLAEVKEARRGE
jgi:(p)ppGpp synthase/HD superfamily hydrolase